MWTHGSVVCLGSGACCMLHNAVCWGDWDGRHVDTADYKALLWLAKGGWGGGGGGGVGISEPARTA